MFFWCYFCLLHCYNPIVFAPHWNANFSFTPTEKYESNNLKLFLSAQWTAAKVTSWGEISRRHLFGDRSSLWPDTGRRNHEEAVRLILCCCYAPRHQWISFCPTPWQRHCNDDGSELKQTLIRVSSIIPQQSPMAILFTKFSSFQCWRSHKAN